MTKMAYFWIIPWCEGTTFSLHVFDAKTMNADLFLVQFQHVATDLVANIAVHIIWNILALFLIAHSEWRSKWIPYVSQMRNIGLIHKYINEETSKTLVQALVISRLDYGNALLFDVPIPDKPPTASTELCCKTGDWHPQKGPHYSNSLPASLAFHMI